MSAPRARRSSETERKFSIEAGRPVPDLSSVVGIGARRRHRLTAVYYDTPDLVLARNRRTLRRRTGGHDAGWHLKLPGEGDTRTEVQLPLTTGAAARLVPAELRDQVAELIGSAPLLPVVELRTRRTETQLTGPRGGARAVLCDDTVTASRRGTEQTWRELEVELTGAELELLDRITEVLAEAGVPVSASVSKLVQAMGERLAEQDRPPQPQQATAAQLLTGFFAAQVGIIQSRETALRSGDAKAVHRVRVASRRLRSMLRSCRELLDDAVSEPLRAELKWFSGLLGATRDPVVLAEQLGGEIAGLPAQAAIGPIAARIEESLQREHAAGQRALVTALDSPRFARLATALLELVVAPPVSEAAAHDASRVLPALLEQTDRRTLRAWRRARKAAKQGTDPAAVEHAWHQVRKRAKAARYAYQAAIPALGEETQRAAATWTTVTKTLGLAQDCVMARERLSELAGAATAAGESAFGYGVLFERQRRIEERARTRAVKALKKARKKARKRRLG